MAIADDLVGHAHIAYLGDPFEQYCGLNGKPLIGGWIEVYQAGTDTRYITMQNFDGAMNPFKIPLNADGRVVMLADPSLTYDMYVRNSYGDLVCSRLNVECTCPGNISIKGLDTYVRNTDGTLDVSLQTSSNNRRVFTVNTKNKLLDVQEPLYFVENSNTATVIGFSGDNYVQKDYLTDFVSSSISGKMDVNKLEYNENGEISAYDGSAFAGQGAGDPEVNDLVHSNSATWNDVSAKLDTTAFSTVSGNFLTAIPDDYATKDYVQSSVSSKLDSTAFSTVSGSFLTAHQSLEDYLTKASADGLYYPLNSNPSGYLTAHQSLDGYLTKASADTLYQPTGDYATHDDLTAYQTIEGMTAYQPSGNYADATALDGKVDTSSFTAFSSTTNEKIEYISGALSGTYELSAGEGIDITDYPNEQKTVISVTAQGGNPEVENLVTAQSATWNSVTGKADTTALNDYATTSQLANKLDTTAFSTVSGDFLTAHQDLSNYATTASVAEKLDTTAFSTVSGDFLTAVDLTPYQTVEGMTAYQPVGDYLSATESANYYPMTGNPSGFLTAHQDISNKLDTTAFSDVSGSFLTAVPDTYLQNTDLTIVDNKITEISGVPLSAGDELPAVVSAAADYVSANSAAINGTIDTVSSNSASWGGEALLLSSRDGIDLEISGDMLYIGASALSAAISAKQDELIFDYNASNAISAINGSALAGGGGGGDVPEGVMSESGLGFNAVNEISGYNGSAIAQYGAEKQWLVHDDTLVHAANSAQYALGVNLSAVAQLLGVDETVLADNILQNATAFTLSEPAGNFERLRLYDYYGTIVEIQGNNSRLSWVFDRTQPSTNIRMNRCYTITSNNGTTWNEVNVYGWNQNNYNGITANGGTDWYLETVKVVGIKRIADNA